MFNMKLLLKLNKMQVEEKNKMRSLILIINDDGIKSSGLYILTDALLAPNFQQTGMGRCALNGEKVRIIDL